MSSWIELQEWHAEHALETFPWSEWIESLTNVFPMPVHDLPRILDTCAAYDIALHAAHWDPAEPVQPVRIPRDLDDMIRSLALHHCTQRMYMARALYAHCSKYVAGVPRIVNPPTDHLDQIEAVPLSHVHALAQATLTPVPARHLYCWLTNAVQYGSTRQLRMCNKHRTHRSSGRRGRKHSSAAESREITESVLVMTRAAFDAIVALSPRYAPTFSCHVISVASGRVNLVLSSQPRAPCGV
jgi:hypothetical protein